MKIYDLDGIITSQHGGAYAWTLVYSLTTHKETEMGTFEHISKHYGDVEIKRMYPFYDSFNACAVLVIETEDNLERRTCLERRTDESE